MIVKITSVKVSKLLVHKHNSSFTWSTSQRSDPLRSNVNNDNQMGQLETDSKLALNRVCKSCLDCQHFELDCKRHGGIV